MRDPDALGVVRVDTAHAFIRFTRLEALLARAESTIWWVLPAIVVGLPTTAVWAVGKAVLAKVIWDWLVRCLPAVVGRPTHDLKPKPRGLP